MIVFENKYKHVQKIKCKEFWNSKLFLVSRIAEWQIPDSDYVKTKKVDNT